MSSPNRRAALCVTCLVDQIMPEIGLAAARLLQRAGYQVDFPPGQSCCGQPFFNSGFRKEARRLARQTIAAFAEEEVVVLPSGSCAAMIRVEYPHLLAGDPAWETRAKEMAAKTFELSHFLTTQAGWQPAPTGDKAAPAVTYHDSCHMRRLLGLYEEPRRLLQQAGCALVEMKESDRCCGFGGLFSIRMPEIANAMTTEKLSQAAQTGADLLVTADPGCLMQMRGLAGDTPIEHIAVVLDSLTSQATTA